MVKVIVNSKRALDRLAKLKVALTLNAIDSVVDRASLVTYVDAIQTTKANIGVRRDGSRWNIQKPENKWFIKKPGQGARIIENADKVTRFLDEGTVAHGPVTKKFLYIPLVRAAAKWTAAAGLKWGVDYILVKWVRGITAKHFIPKVRKRAEKTLRTLMLAYVRKAVKGA